MRPPNGSPQGTRLFRLSLACAALLALMLIGAEALARPGGGQTFGGGGHHGHGGGDGGGELIFFLLRLVFAYPKVGVPLLVIGIIVILWARKQTGFESWETGATHGVEARAVRPATTSLEALRALDPDFSQVIFEDFAYRLYAAAHRARRDERALSGLAPYLSQSVRESLSHEMPSALSVSNVVVGAMRIQGVRVPDETTPDGKVEIMLAYESNLTLGSPPQERTFYMRERWQLSRDRSARTRPPEETERLGCPNCGAPFQSSDDRRCAYCDQVVDDGRFAWQVTSRRVLLREVRPPALTSEVAEHGTELPTRVDAGRDSAFQALCARDPALSEPAIEARLRLIYATLNRAYSALDLAPARGLLSDGMFDYLRYWTEAYKAQGLRNVLENMRIERSERAKVVSDRYFDALTYRVWATGLDYTVDVATGARVSGSQSVERRYSEYWTLIRAAGRQGPVHSDARCPSCAAPLSVTMAGTCSYCSAHVTRGEFDWVLSKVEQDDVYAG